MFTTALAWLTKEVWSKLTFKHILIIIGALALCFAQYQFYGWSKDRGMAAQAKLDAPVIAKLTKERNDLNTKYNAYKQAHYTWVYRSELARLKLKAENEATNRRIEADLAKAREQLKRSQGIKYDIPKFIPPSVDTSVPAGFVRVFNVSLEGEPGSTAEPFGVPGSFRLPDTAPSGLTLSAVAEVIADNNAECVYRGKVILGWQTWYDESRASFTKAQQEAADAIPRVEGDQPPSNAIQPTATTDETARSPGQAAPLR